MKTKYIVAIISVFLISSSLYANEHSLKKVEVMIDARPFSERMEIKTRLYLQKKEGAGDVSSFSLKFLKPKKIGRFIDQGTGEEIEYRFRLTREDAIRAGYNLIQFKLESKESDITLLLEYEYDRETFSGFFLSPTTYGNLHYGQITKKGIFSSHLYYYPSGQDGPQEAQIVISTPQGWIGATSGKLK